MAKYEEIDEEFATVYFGEKDKVGATMVWADMDPTTLSKMVEQAKEDFGSILEAA